MPLHSLRLSTFRCYQEAVFSFPPDITLVAGPNAKGKTSILEAIYLLGVGRSFRSSTHLPLIHTGQAESILEACFSSHSVENRLSLFISSNEKRAMYNMSSLSQLTHLLGLLCVVLTTPDDLALITGSPSFRRRFLDLQIAQTNSTYIHFLARYFRAMRHRNALLKAGTPGTIQCWEEEMATAALYVISARKTYLTELNLLSNTIYSQFVSDAPSVSLHYSPSFSQKEDPLSMDHMMQTWERLRAKEFILGHTLAGPHRDDFIIKLGDKESRAFSSEGEKRSMILALRLAEWMMMKEKSENAPLLLIDDFGMGLDPERKDRLSSLLSALKGQVIVTAADPYALGQAPHTLLKIG